MNEERLQEIKDSIDFQRKFLITCNMQTLCVDEEMELYNEIIRLNQKIDKALEYIKSVYERNEDGTDNIWILDFGEIQNILKGDSDE